MMSSKETKQINNDVRYYIILVKRLTKELASV